MKRTAASRAAALLLLLLLPGLARAQAGDTADIRVRVIHATQGKKHFDSKLEDLKKYLRIYQYSSYRQVIDETLVLKTGETRGIGLLRGKNLNVTLAELTPEKASLQMKLFGKAGVMLDTRVKVGRDGLFVIAGPRYNQGVLFMAVGAKYDPGPEEARVSGAK